MGKAALMAVGAVVLIAAYYSFGTQSNVMATNAKVAEHQVEVLARGAAIMGYNRARQNLATSFAAQSFSGSYETADYVTTVTLAGLDHVRIRSVGTATDGMGNEKVVTVEAEIMKELFSELPPEAPPFMQYALMAENNISLQGTMNADIFVTGDESNTLNANVHTNGSLSVEGNVSVNGFGTYVGNFTKQGNKQFFNPNYNPTNAAVTQRTARVNIPSVDAAFLAANANVSQVTVGNLAVSSSMTLGGTRENPFIWYVTGDLTLNGGAKFDGYVLFLVGQDVYVSGGVSAGDSQLEGGDESTLGVYAGRDIHLSGNSTLYGQIMAGRNVSFGSGTSDIYGNVVSSGSALFAGTPRIHYRRASPALTTVFDPNQVRYRLLSYNEW
jgi:hypothetical protein